MYKWKRCITGSLDFVNKNDEPVFHIFRKNFDSRWSGQVFYGQKYSDLIYEDTLELFILKAITKAKDHGWEVDFKNINLSPDFSNIEEYESLMFKNELSEEDKDFWRLRSKVNKIFKKENEVG